MKSTAQMIEVMQAFVDGKEIETSHYADRKVWEKIDNPRWNWANFDYQVKPEVVKVHVYRYEHTGSYYFYNKKLDHLESFVYCGEHEITLEV